MMDNLIDGVRAKTMQLSKWSGNPRQLRNSYGTGYLASVR